MDKTELGKELVYRCLQTRIDTPSFPVPSASHCLDFCLTELGEWMDALMRLKDGYKRNNNRHRNIAMEAGQALDMAVLALVQIHADQVIYDPLLVGSRTPAPLLSPVERAKREIYAAVASLAIVRVGWSDFFVSHLDEMDEVQWDESLLGQLWLGISSTIWPIVAAMEHLGIDPLEAQALWHQKIKEKHGDSKA